MNRKFTLSVAGLGLFLIVLGAAYLYDLNSNRHLFTTVLRFYPLLPILLGLDFLLSGLPNSSRVIDRPSGWIVTLIILLTFCGLVFTLFNRFAGPHLARVPGIHFGFEDWWTGQETVRTIKRDFQLPPGITTVRLENDLGNVTVNSSATQRMAAVAAIKLRGHLSRRMRALEEQADLIGEVQNDHYLIRLRMPEPWRNGKAVFSSPRVPWNYRRHFRLIAANINITLPKGVAVEICAGAGDVASETIDGNLTVELANGKIAIGRVNQNLDARNSLGEIKVQSVAGNAFIKSSAGKIAVDRIGGAATVESSLGEVQLLDCAGPVQAKVDSGRLKVNLTKVARNCDLDVSLGSAEIGIARNAGFILDAQTSMGSVHSDFPVAVNQDMMEMKANGAVNGGGPLIRVKTGSGSIQLQKL